MKDSRFIELINLYVDRQISQEETAELEAEIQSSPRRRQVYRQYCQMHHATKLVYESFRAHADQPAAGARQPATIAQFAHRRRANQRARWLYAAGGLAAAACLAFVLLRPGLAPQPATVLAAAPVSAPVVAAAEPAPAAVAVAPAEAQVIKFSAAVREEPDYAAMLAALRQEDARRFALGQSVRNASLFDDGVFDGKQMLPFNARRPATIKRPDGRAQAEFTAFQFQR